MALRDSPGPQKILHPSLTMDWAIYQPRVRFDARAESRECEFLFSHQARVLQDRIVRRSHTDRTKQHAIPEWEKLYQAEAAERRLLHHARVLSWGKEKSYYYAHKDFLGPHAIHNIRQS